MKHLQPAVAMFRAELRTRRPTGRRERTDTMATTVFMLTNQDCTFPLGGNISLAI